MPSRSLIIAMLAGLLLGASGPSGGAPSSAAARTETGLTEEVQAAVDLSSVQLLVSAGDYAKLQAYIDKAVKQHPTTPIGSSRRAMLYDDITSSMTFSTRGAGCVSASDRMVEAWKQAMPRSGTAWIVAARHEANRAQCWRGEGYIDTVKPEDAVRFQTLVDAAQHELARHADAAASDPEWYVAMIDFARYQSWPNSDTMKLIMSGSDRYPAYYRIYNHGMLYFSAQWEGSDSTMEAYAEAMSKRAQPVLHDETYARMYKAVFTTFGTLDYRKDSPIDWGHMVRSMRDVVRHYPDYENVLTYARISCYSGDVSAFPEFARYAKTPRAANEAKASVSRADCERVLSNHPQL